MKKTPVLFLCIATHNLPEDDALFVYLAVRVRSAAQIWAVLKALGVVAVLELVVVLAQWKTHGTFGLSFLGTPTALGTRVFNDGTAGRPFGTLNHPAFLGALLGGVAILALTLAIGLRDRRTKLVCLAMAPVAAMPLAISNVRASLLGLFVGGLIVVVVSLVQRKVSAVVLVTAITLGAVAAGAAWPIVSRQFSHSFGSQHYSLEVQARTQLNALAESMISDRPVIGVGLNNFQVAMVPYERYPLVFPDNAVHNIFLLVMAETGVVGFAGVAVLWIALLWVALRLARSQDRLGAALGLAATAVYLFLASEEMLSYSLREDAPLALFWILAGLTVAASSFLPGSATGPGARRREAPAPDLGHVQAAGPPLVLERLR
ncbi:MAG: hypothetical protein NVSMB32_08100 [Actinomycetota bacterium]